MKYGSNRVNRPFTRPTVPAYHPASGYTLYVMTMWMTVYHVCILGLSCTPYFEVFRGVQMTSNSSKTDEIDMKYGCHGVNRPSKCLTVPSYHSASTILRSQQPRRLLRLQRLLQSLLFRSRCRPCCVLEWVMDDRANPTTGRC